MKKFSIIFNNDINNEKIKLLEETVRETLPTDEITFEYSNEVILNRYFISGEYIVKRIDSEHNSLNIKHYFSKILELKNNFTLPEVTKVLKTLITCQDIHINNISRL